ncbi:MAG: RICIN domain-containing protein, partial [Oscillospiraceae bacterium]|nr:RICIN domain-containing protein [Oscillospiraceae bacterium]
DGYCSFTDSATGNVMTVNGAAAQGQGLTVSPYNGSDSQLWKLEDAGDDSYFIHSKLDPSLVLDNFGATAASGAAIVLYPKNNGSNQRFRFVPETTVKPRSEWGASRSDCGGSAWDYWDGSSDSSWYYADTAAYTYTIDSASQLAGAAQLVRDRVTDFYGKTIVLKKDLNLCGSEWQKIGTKDSPFRGSFNGGGHAIIGLTVTGSDQYTGFFGCADGGSICHFAIQGSVTGDTVVGGVCGWLRAGHISDIYSEITLPKATEDYQGGICGLAEFAGYIENCTQNARVNSYDRDSYRGGIAGYSRANIRGCVNRGAVECDWNNVGGITGFCEGGKIEYCANYGRVGGGDWAERVGGICGESSSDAVIFSCRNEGEVFSSGDDHIGGIVGWQTQNSRVLGCINLGTVHGDTYVGGIVGEGICACSLNAGHVSGDGKVGAVSGNTTLTNWCRALSGTAGSLNGKGGDCEAAWVSEEDLVSGKAAYELNCRSDTGGVLLNYAYGIHNTVAANVFYQNLGADPYPEFTGAAVVSSGGSVRNDMYAVSVEYDAELGTVTGGGSYQSGSVTLSAKPASGCVFDRYEVTQMNGTASETTTYKDAQITLTDDIRRSYAVRAVFSVYDDTPAELRQSVRLELECTNDVSGWNSNVIPVFLVDSTGKQHAWNIPCSVLNEPGRKAEHTFALGTASPTAVYAYNCN